VQSVVELALETHGPERTAQLLEQLAAVEDVDFSDESFIDKVRNIFG